VSAQQYLALEALWLILAILVVRDVRALRRRGVAKHGDLLQSSVGWFIMVALTGAVAAAYYVWVRRTAIRRAAGSAPA
jgi:hypothetical protein